MILSEAGSAKLAVERASCQISKVLNRITKLGLTVATEKTEAVVFYGGRKKLEDSLTVKVGKNRIAVGETMKYLGIMLDRRLSFRSHFEYIESKVSKASRALARIMPNLHGPGERKRRLYATVVLSVIMYGAPVWCTAFNKKKEVRVGLNRL